MSEISLKSITGITSITTPAGVDNQLTLHNNNTTEAVKVDTAGNVHVNNQLLIAGITTFTNGAGVGDFKPIQLEKSGTTGATRIQFLESGTNKGGITYSHDNNRIEIQAESSGKIRFNDVSNAQFALLDGTGLTVNGASGITALAADINGDLDVDGHTNLDNVSIAGITTVALNQELVFGSNADSQLTGRIKQLSGSSPSMQITSKYPRINALDFRIHNISNNQHYAYFWSTEVALFHQGNKKFSTTGGGIDVTGTIVADGLELTSTDSGAAAAPTLRLQRDSSSPANGDILGEIMFGGKDSTPNDENYASVAGKIIQAGAGGEHGAIQITTRKASANVITANLTSTDYELLNGTNLSVDGDITGNGNFQLTSTDTGSSAAPELTLHRNSASPADADYLGQIKFSGKHDGGSSVNYAKITGKILDASNGSEDGILEFAHIKAGSQNISARFRSDSLQLLNGTSLTVAGTADVTGMLNANGDITITSPSPTINFTENNGDPDYRIFLNGGIFTIDDVTNNIGKFSITTSRITLNDTVLVNDNILYIGDKLVHWTDDDTAIRFPSNDQISFETGGSERGRFDDDGNFLIGTTSHGNAGSGARHLVISGPSNQGLTINSTTTSGIYRDCNIYFGYGTSTTDMAKGQLTYSGNSDFFHMSVGNTSYTLAKSFRLNGDGTVRFDSTHTDANSQSLVIKSHKARALNDNNGIVFRDANDHTQAVINVTKMSTSDATSDLVFRTSSGQVVNTLQGIPERMRIKSDGHVLPAITNTQDLGSSSKRWRNVYTTDLQLSNEGKTNDVDNTWGDYTIQEGESDLFLINNRNGKKYKFNLTEVS